MSEQIEDLKKLIAHIQSLNLEGKQKEIQAIIVSTRILYDF
jgi:collagenase-like PrtC family protease